MEIHLLIDRVVVVEGFFARELIKGNESWRWYSHGFNWRRACRMISSNLRSDPLTMQILHDLAWSKMKVRRVFLVGLQLRLVGCTQYCGFNPFILGKKIPVGFEKTSPCSFVMICIWFLLNDRFCFKTKHDKHTKDTKLFLCCSHF